MSTLTSSFRRFSHRFRTVAVLCFSNLILFPVASMAAGEEVTVTQNAIVPAAEHSTITVTPVEQADNAAPVIRAGQMVAVTVTLKDEKQHPVGNLNTLLHGDAVTVSGMMPADGADWQEEEEGVYRMMYVANNAGDTHRAILRLAGFSKATEPYSIRAGAVAADESIIALDKYEVVADNISPIAVTFTVKDSYGNAVTGLTEEGLTLRVREVNSSTFSGFTESAPGTYTGSLTGTEPGTVYLMPLVGAEEAASNEVQLDLLANSPSYENSFIRISNPTFTAGDDITVTVMLRNANGTPFPDAKALLEAENVVVVPNTDLKEGSDWVVNGDGSWSKTWLAHKAQAALTATLKLTEWEQASEPYTIRAGAVFQSKSKISLQDVNYGSGQDMPVKVELRDKYENPVPDMAASLAKEDVVKLQFVVKRDNTQWKFNDDGSYTATYEAALICQDIKASLQLDGWDNPEWSETVYSIVAGEVDKGSSEIKLSSDAVTADNEETVKVTFLARDRHGNPVDGLQYRNLNLLVEGENAPDTTFSNFMYSAAGTYEGILKGRVAGTVTLMARLDEIPVAQKAISLRLDRELRQ